MDLNFEIFMIVLVVLGIVVVGNFLRDGESNWLEGALLVVSFAIFFFPPPLLIILKYLADPLTGENVAKTDRLRNHRHRILVLPEPRRGDIERHRGIGRLSKQHHHRQSFAKEPINHGEPKSVIERLQITSNPHECSRLVIHKQDIQTQKYTNIPSRSQY